MSNPEGINQYTKGAARAALVTPNPNKSHTSRRGMAANIKEARSVGVSGCEA